MSQLSPSFVGPLTVPLTGSSNITVLNTTSHIGNASGSANTTNPISTIGASYIQLGVTSWTLHAPPTITDSKGNTWNLIRTEAQGSGFNRIQVYDCNGPTTDAAHTFSTTQVASFGNSIFVIALSGTDPTTPLDKQNGSLLVNSNTIQPGSVTPSFTGEILITFVESGEPTVDHIDLGYTIAEFQPYSGFTSVGGAMAYLIRGSAASSNPTWSWTNTSHCESIITTVKSL